MIHDSRFSIQECVAAVVSPFATASAILLLTLSFVEYFRHGFVSLFLDFRILAAVTLALWVAAVFLEVQPRGRVVTSVAIGLALAALAPILWRMTASYGRLGLATFICGAAALVIVFLSSLNAKR